jgi:hypothetical protein
VVVWLVHLHRATQEFYEENPRWLFPRYALKVLLRPDK